MQKSVSNNKIIYFAFSIYLIPLLTFAGKKTKYSLASRTKLGKIINSKFADLAPSVSADGKVMVFQSNRPGGKGSHDLWITYKDDKGKWIAPVNLKVLNSKSYDGLATLSADGKSIYFVSNRGKTDTNDEDIYVSHFGAEGWSKPVHLSGNINTKYYEAMPKISFDGKKLYFTSSRPGGFGGQDIYVSVKKKDGSWGKPKNLGSVINSSYDDTNPVILHDNVTLFFSSNRSDGLGGYDLYFSKRGQTGEWEPPVNLGVPINDSEDQFFFAMPATGEFIYTSSGDTNKQNEDIYKVIVPDWLKPTPIAMINGFVLEEGKELPVFASLSIRDSKSKILSKKSKKQNGEYLLILKIGKKYNLTVRAKGYYKYSDKINLKNVEAKLKINKNIYLSPIVIGSKLLENQVYFRTGKKELTDESKIALHKLIMILKNNPDLRIRIVAYADRRGKKYKNIKLSLKRAEEVKKYLIENDITEDRLETEGGGEIGPKVKNRVPRYFKKELKLQRSRKADFIIVE